MDSQAKHTKMTVSLPAAPKAFDPTLAALFASSLVSPKKLKRSYPDFQESSTSKAASTSVSERERIDFKSTLGNGSKIIDSYHAKNAEQASAPGSFDTQTSSKKRKRKDREGDDDLEGTYMRRLAQEEVIEEQERADGRSSKRQRPGLDSIEGANSDSERTDMVTSIGENGVFTPPPQHESLAPSKEQDDLEKASRTVFLANVSTLAIKSKTAKKALLDHLTSFVPTILEQEPLQRIESLRFRSTAFASSVVPKRAAYAKKELMDATTKSTNAYVVYTTKAAAREAMKSLNGTVVLDRHLRVDGVAHPAKTDHRRCVFVGNLGFVDDESIINAAVDEAYRKRSRKAKEPADVEEGLWRQFSKAGVVESVRVVRDKTTRVGKGIAYVQFKDENGVEKALLYNEKKFPPMLPRVLRVTRAKNVRKTVSYTESSKTSYPKDTRARKDGSYNPRVSSQVKSLSGRAGKLLGRAGAAQIKASGENERTFNRKAGGVAISPEAVVFEGYRASSKQGKGTMGVGGSGKKHGKPRNRSSKRGAAFKASGGKMGRK